MGAQPDIIDEIRRLQKTYALLIAVQFASPQPIKPVQHLFDQDDDGGHRVACGLTGRRMSRCCTRPGA